MAVLLILIVTGSLLAAYFRNYSSEAPAHEHNEKGKSDGADTGKADMSAMKPDGDSHAAAGHDKPRGAQPQPQVETSPAPQSQKEGAYTEKPPHEHEP